MISWQGNRSGWMVLVPVACLGFIACDGTATNIDPTTTDVFRVIETGEGSCGGDNGVPCIEIGDVCPETEGVVCESEPVPPEAQPPEEGGCWVTGIGTFGKGVTRDSFGGNAMTMKDGSVRGEWQHVDHFDVSGSQKNGQNLFHGKVEYIRCERFPTLNGPEVPKAVPNFANWGGHGKFNHVDGYKFDVRAFDHAEGGIYRDRYAIQIWDPEGNLVLEANGMATNDIANGPGASMGAKGNGNGKGGPHAEEPATTGRDIKCLEDPTITSEDLAWVAELGCLSGGNFQIHPPNKGHPY